MTPGKGSRFSVLPRSSSPHCFQSEDSPPLTPLTRAQEADTPHWLLLVWSRAALPYRRVLCSRRGRGRRRPGPCTPSSYLQEGGTRAPVPLAPPGSHEYASSARRPGSPGDRPGSASAAASSGSRLGDQVPGEEEVREGERTGRRKEGRQGNVNSPGMEGADTIGQETEARLPYLPGSV